MLMFELATDPMVLAALMAVAFLAGFIDAIAGGGGLLTLPALLTAGLQQQDRAVVATPAPCRRGYWLVAPLPQWRQKKVKALVATLTAEA